MQRILNIKHSEPKNIKKIKSNGETLTNAEKMYSNRNDVTEAFENRFFPFSHEFQKKKSQACLINHYEIG